MTVANSFFERATKYAKATTRTKTLTTALVKNALLILDQTSFGKCLILVYVLFQKFADIW